jgi:glycosyltransferase involved in cell wall biosynthesis
MHTDGSTTPYISVIITAFNRRKYLIYAINSVLNQTISKNTAYNRSYEIIVVKNFYDAEIDSFLENNDIINIKSENVSIGKKLAEGIIRARGEILCFLEDDDEFLPTKLEKVQYMFSRNDKMVYYHNAFQEIRSETDMLPSYMPSDTGRGKVGVYSTPQKLRELIYMTSGRGIALNMSAISIRKSFYMSFMPVLSQVETLQDLSFFLFYIFAANDSEKFGFDPNFLSIYRVHSSTTQFEKTLSVPEWKKKVIGIAELSLNAMIVLRNAFNCLEPPLTGNKSVLCKYFLLSIAGWRVELNMLQGKKTTLSDITHSLEHGLYRHSIEILGGTILALLGNVFGTKTISIVLIRIMKNRQSV